MITTFILDGVISNYIIIDLILFYFYFHEERHPFLIGLCYDIIYTDTLFLHAFLFFLVSYGISKIKNIYSFFVILSLYHLIEYVLLITLKIHIFEINDIFILIRTTLINIILVYIINRIHKRKKSA